MIIKILRGRNHQSQHSSMFLEGLQLDSSVSAEIVPAINSSVDLAVLWGHRQIQIINNQRKNNKPYLVMERAYMGDRFDWVSLGFNGLNGRADFCNHDIISSSRWDKYFSQYLKPWKDIDRTKPVLVIGQVTGDAAHSHIDIHQWYRDTIKYYNDNKISVIFRPHPLGKDDIIQYLKGLTFKLDTNSTLEETFKEIRAVISLNSNSSVLSVLEGIPTVTCDIGAMAYDVTSHDLSDIEYTPDRTKWCNQLAYTQWTPDEIRSGVAWQHLKKFFIK